MTLLPVIVYFLSHNVFILTVTGYFPEASDNLWVLFIVYLVEVTL